MWSPVIVALGRACAVSTALVFPGVSAASVIGQLFPTPTNELSLDTAAVERVIVLLERLNQDQTRLGDAIKRLEVSQLTAWERQLRTIRQHQSLLTERISAERDRDRQALDDLGRLALALLLSVAGALLFAMGAIAWSVLRALQRLSLPPLVPRMMAGQETLGLSLGADAQLLSLVAELERRWLKLGESNNATANPVGSPNTPKASPGLGVPGDFI